MEFEGNALNSSEQRCADGLDYILKELDLLSDCMDQLEGNTTNIFPNRFDSLIHFVDLRQYCKITF